MMKSVIRILVLSLLAIMFSCRKETDRPVSIPPSPVQEIRTIHYKATIQTGIETRATVDNLKYEFEVGDQVYMASVDANGDADGNLYGFLSLSVEGGVGKNVALFEGDLNCASNFEPSLDTHVKLVLVSPEDELHVESVLFEVPAKNYHNKSAESLQEAIRHLSHFTGEGLFGDTRFELNQQSSFLVMSLSFDPATVIAGANVTANLINHYGEASNSSLGTVSCQTVDVNGDIEASWVFAFSPGTELSGARLEVSVGNVNIPALRMANATLQANTYYTFQRATYMMEYFTVEAIDADTEITFNYATSSNGIQYSLDGYEWLNYNSSITLSTTGDKVYFRGKANNYKNTGTTPLLTTGDKACYVYGDIMFLMCDEKYKPRTAIPANYAFQGAFKNATWLRISGEEGKTLKLSATSLTNGCYESMFEGCTGLEIAPALSATSLASGCYRAMFKGCTSLTSAPVLPAAALVPNCYYEMFRDCSNLNKVTCMATSGINTDNSTNNWLQNVSSTGEFIQSLSATWPRSVSGIPVSWTCRNGFVPGFPDDPFDEEDF